MRYFHDPTHRDFRHPDLSTVAVLKGPNHERCHGNQIAWDYSQRFPR